LIHFRFYWVSGLISGPGRIKYTTFRASPFFDQRKIAGLYCCLLHDGATWAWKCCAEL